MKYKSFISILFIIIIIGGLSLSKIDNYKDNSWGILYVTINSSPMYYFPEKEYSTYKVLDGTLLMCDTKYKNEHFYEINGRVFCWYLFDVKREPISGWIETNNIEKYEK